MQRKALQMAAQSKTGRVAGACGVAVVAAALLLSMAAVEAKEALSLEQARTSFVIAEEPAAALSVGDTQKLLEKAPKNRAAVTIVGRIAAREGEDPFLEGTASFVLIDLPDDDHASTKGHDADNCPFCKKRQANAPMVAVQFLGADGKVIPIDSRQLFGIAKGNEVVVKGTAVFDPKLALPIVQFTADGIFVRGQ